MFPILAAVSAQQKKAEPKKAASNKPKRPEDDEVSTFNTDK